MSNRKAPLTVGDAISRFSEMDTGTKASFLASLAWELTVMARDTYEVGGTGLTDPQRMRAINEVQHQLLNFLTAILRSDVGRYTDDVIVHMILEHPDDANLERQMSSAFSRALSMASVAA